MLPTPDGITLSSHRRLFCLPGQAFPARSLTSGSWAGGAEVGGEDDGSHPSHRGVLPVPLGPAADQHPGCPGKGTVFSSRGAQLVSSGPGDKQSSMFPKCSLLLGIRVRVTWGVVLQGRALAPGEALHLGHRAAPHYVSRHLPGASRNFAKELRKILNRESSCVECAAVCLHLCPEPQAWNRAQCVAGTQGALHGQMKG